MHRRTVLAVVPSLLAGCTISGSDTGDGSTSTHATETVPTTTTDTTTATTTKRPYDPLPVDPASMTREEVRQLLADRDCAEYTEHPRTCSGSDGRLSVSISPTIGDLSGDTVKFVIENSTDEPFVTNHYGWTLRKWDGNQWRRLAPLSIPAPLDRIRAGESHAYRVTPVENNVVRSQQAYITESNVTLGGLGPGVYGFTTHGYFESTPNEERSLGAVFGFAGEAPPVRPTDDVTRVERDGSTLLVHADAPSGDGGKDASSGKSRELIVSLVDGEADAELLAEHVHQLGALLNTLPYAATDGVRTVRYAGPAADVSMARTYLSGVMPAPVTRYGFRDYVFELSVKEA